MSELHCRHCGEVVGADANGRMPRDCPHCDSGRDLSLFVPEEPQRTREAIAERLSELRKSSRPKLKSTCFAMCYQMVSHNGSAHYVCGICGERTWHEGGTSEAYLINSDLLKLRRGFKQLSDTSGLAFQLDEQNLCRQCVPSPESVPLLSLSVRYTDGSGHVVEYVSTYDLEMLEHFFAGDLKYFPDGQIGSAEEVAVKKQLPRLRELLGFPKETLWTRLRAAFGPTQKASSVGQEGKIE